jgi:hypothetical protein
VFREEFQQDYWRGKTKGLKAWQKRKMIRIRDSFLNYFTTVPALDSFSLEEQNELISRLAQLAGLPG